MKMNSELGFGRICKGFIKDYVLQLPKEEELECDLSREMQDKIFAEVFGEPCAAQAADTRRKRLKTAIIVAAILAAVIALAVFVGAVTHYTSGGMHIDFRNDCAVIYPAEARAVSAASDVPAMSEIIAPQGYKCTFHKSFEDGLLAESFSCDEGSVQVLLVTDRNAVLAIDYNGGARALDGGENEVFVWEKDGSTHVIVVEDEKIFEITGNIDEEALLSFAEAKM